VTPSNLSSIAGTKQQHHGISHLHILYLDDEPVVRATIGEGLRSFKHEVLLASSGEAALQMFSASLQSGTPFDAVITDLGMPNINGMEFARSIKRYAPATPVIMLTGWGGRELHGQGNEVVDAVLEKPVSLKQLNTTLLQVTSTRTRHG
jgi:CheY-like chemotaxis protein